MKTLFKNNKAKRWKGLFQITAECRTTSCAFMIANAAAEDKITSMAWVILALAARCSAVNLDWIEKDKKTQHMRFTEQGLWQRKKVNSYIICVGYIGPMLDQMCHHSCMSFVSCLHEGCPVVLQRKKKSEALLIESSFCKPDTVSAYIVPSIYISSPLS